MKLKQKDGISLMVLVITLVIITLLAGVIVTSISVTTDNANLSVLANDIAQLQESARSMYIMEEKLPIVDNATKITRSDILNLVNSKNKTAFDEELTLNGESENTYFYQLDLEKAGAGDIEKGKGINDPDDIFVISASSLRVYYLKGIEYDGNMYFSINSKMLSIITLPDTFEDESNLTINTFESVTVSRPKNGYTGNLGIKIIANMEENEILTFSFEGINEMEFNLSVGKNVIEINSIYDFNNYISTPLSDIEITSFNNLTKNNAVIILNKYKNNTLVGTNKIDISNYDNAAPTIQINSIQEYDDFYIVNGNVQDSLGIVQSGGAQLRYDYKNYNGVTTTFDENYMKTKAKNTIISEDGGFSIKVPKEVAILTVAAIDKVGNIVIQDIDL